MPRSAKYCVPRSPIASLRVCRCVHCVCVCVVVVVECVVAVNCVHVCAW
jgi:hypothetical protein